MNFPNKREESALDAIEHQLYDPKITMGGGEVHAVKGHRPLDLPTSWGDDALIMKQSSEGKGLSFGTKLFFVSLLFLFVAVGVSFWKVVSLRNVVSADNIDMTATISPYLEGGESTPLTLTLLNKNRSPLEASSVTLLYKQGNGSQDEQEKIQEKKDIGVINVNEYKKQDFSVVLYGSEGESRDLIIKLEYKVAGSNATFSKVVNTHVILKTPPISVSIDGPDKLSIGQTGTYTFTIKNNSATTSLPSILSLTLPNSLTTESTTPKPIARSTSWNIAPLKSGDTAHVSFTGSFEGKQGESATIAAKIGSLGENASTIGIVYAMQSIDIALRASPLSLGIGLISDNAGNDSIKYNDRATLTLSYNNMSAQALEDVTLKLTVSGDAPVYDLIDPTNGYYDSIHKTITWDKASLPDLAVLPPNSQGFLRVIVPIVQKGSNSPKLQVSFVGTGQSKASDDVATTLSKTWGVQGSATLVATTQYKNSPFENSGPIPPEPNEITTYTAHLSVSAQNTLSSSKVSFTLPAYVSWRDITTNDSQVTFDSKTRTVIWNTGRLEQGGTSVVDIGLSVKPSQSHVAQSPPITSGIILDADEEISKAHLRTTLSPLTTGLHNESWPKNPALVVKP